MHIQGVVGDPLPHFFWLIEVANTWGGCMGVLSAGRVSM